MPENDDLFAGLTIGQETIPDLPEQQVAQSGAGISQDNADLFQDLIVGNTAISLATQDLTAAQPAPTQAAPPQPAIQATPRRGRPGQAARLQEQRDKSPFGLPDELRTRNLRPTPPETGASTNESPLSFNALATCLAVLASMVLESITNAFLSIASRTAESPR